MKLRTLLITLLVVFGLALAACGGSEDTAVQEEAAPPAAQEQEAEPVVEEAVEEPVVEEETAVEEVAEEPTAEPVEEMAEADLDTAFQVFLDDMEAYNTIGLDALNEMMVDGTVFILDVRQPGELEEKGWIEGAVNIPLSEVADSIEYLPDEDTTIVSYCGSGWRCTIALAALEGMGWEDVLGLKGGSYGGWVEAGYPIEEGTPPEPEALNEAEPDPALVAEMQEMLHNVPEDFGIITADALATELVENPDLILIDVRRPDEVEGKGYIDAENLLFIPLEEFVAMQDEWPADLDAPIVIYCGSGHRSTIAMSILWTYGYTDVRSLKGGYGGWAEGGYPTVGAPEPEAAEVDVNEAFQVFLDDMEAYNTIGIDALNTMLVEGDEVFILDVRQPGELEEKGWIEGAVNIPLREIGDSIEYLPDEETTIVSYCGSGWRCTIALAALEGMGWEDVLSLKDGSYGGWVEAGYPIAEGEIPELVALNEAEPDPALVAVIGDMLANVPDGYGIITADDLFLEQGENEDLILIDVRRTDELEEKGIIDHDPERWIHIPLEEFAASADMWPEDLDAPIVVYCGSGHRSTIGMTILWANGYTDVQSLKGGFGAWTEAGYPVVEYAP